MKAGTSILLTKSDKPEVTNVSQFGIWVVASGSEFFISYSDYPVFEGAPLLSVVKVEADFEGNLHWQELDADIELEALKNPEKYPLQYKA